MAQPGSSRSPRTEHGVTAHFTALLRTLNRDLFDSYRPERHYMRGPGPKWHAKHARQEAVVDFPSQAAKAI